MDYIRTNAGTGRMAPTLSSLDDLFERLAPCPWSAMAGLTGPLSGQAAPPRRALYTVEERSRRDSTVWTTVQGVLAPIQFAVFLVSLGLVLNYLATGHGYAVATASVITKTLVLYLIMVTGSIWEKVVFGRYLFAPAFLWEDVFSMLVLALHTAYLAAVMLGLGTPESRMILALAAYASYAINATQFILKLRAARLEAQPGNRTGGARG
jgi:3-vinyl bacteriochlorophyllide hydratase